jgi:hydroxypyruvate isomerase
MTITRRLALKNLLLSIPALDVSFKEAGSLKAFIPDTEAEVGSGVRIYSRLINAREYPDDKRRNVQPPNWETFDNKIQFITLRGFQLNGTKLVYYKEDLDLYTQKLRLGNVVWPHRSMLVADNLPEVVEEIKRRKLFLHDIWGYVPGSGKGDWEQFKLDTKTSELFERVLGDHWLGMDNGEQDGRYIGLYAEQNYPIREGDRIQKYLNFQAHFERLTTDLGNKMAVLVSLNFGHYFLKEGVYTFIGAETAQGLPNGQVYYSFIRGAGKQYGVPWFGNASVYNRWGYKNYDSEGGSGGDSHGPTKGASLSLLKRLIYSHILYNCMMSGFESGYIYNGNSKFKKTATDVLAPIGHIQVEAVKWVDKYGSPGVMLTPIALMVDFFSGWTFPRHLYTDQVYRVWGNMPYEAGDYLTDGVLDMLYPGYQNSSFYHDENGFLTATPYGDVADCLLSDAESWVLDRYAVLIVAGALTGGVEIKTKLENYAANGGHLIITAGSLAKLPGGVAGIRTSETVKLMKPGQKITGSTGAVTETASFAMFSLEFPKTASVTFRAGEMPAVVEMTLGKGRITVFASEFGISKITPLSLPQVIDQPLQKPYSLLVHFRKALEAAFKGQQLFEVDKNLSLITCRKEQGTYTLGITNNTWESQPLKINSRFGEIESVTELPLDQTEKSELGYLPEVLQGRKMTDAEGFIAGGDVKLFLVKLKEKNVEVLPDNLPFKTNKARILQLSHINSIKEELLKRPTFFEHFDGVLVDWKYFRNRDAEALKEEAVWINLQKLGITIDLTPGINLYPDLRVINNVQEDYDKSLATIFSIMEKGELLGVKNIIVSHNRVPENNTSEEEAWKLTVETFKLLCSKAAEKGITLHLRFGQESKAPRNVKLALQFLDEVDAKNLLLAVDLGYLFSRNVALPEVVSQLKGKTGYWLVAGKKVDEFGKNWSIVVPFARSSQKEKLRDLFDAAPDAPIVCNALYKNLDE